MTHDELTLHVAKAIAAAWGELWENIAASAKDWRATHGIVNSKYRDFSLPYQDDYLEMAEAAIKAMEQEEP